MPESLLIKLPASAFNYTKKEALAQVFSCEFCEILRTYFLHNTSGYIYFLHNTYIYIYTHTHTHRNSGKKNLTSTHTAHSLVNIWKKEQEINWRLIVLFIHFSNVYSEILIFYLSFRLCICIYIYIIYIYIYIYYVIYLYIYIYIYILYNIYYIIYNIYYIYIYMCVCVNNLIFFPRFLDENI